MSVVDVTTRHTHDRQEFDANRASDRSLILLDKGTGIEGFSIDLTIGSGWSEKYSDLHNGMYGIPEAGIVLKPRSSVVIEVEESLTIPFNVYGLVIPTGSQFLDRGIILAAAKIEPSFTGKLKLRLVNTSAERHVLTPRMKVASAIFFATEQTRYQKEVRKSVKPGLQLPSRTRRLRSWIGENRVAVIGWIVTFSASSVSALLIATFVLAPRYAVPAPPAPTPRAPPTAAVAAPPKADNVSQPANAIAN